MFLLLRLVLPSPIGGTISHSTMPALGGAALLVLSPDGAEARDRCCSADMTSGARCDHEARVVAPAHRV